MCEPTLKIKTNIDKNKHEHGVRVSVKLACDKGIVAPAEYSKSFSKSDQSAYQKTSAVTSDFNNPSEDYVNYISANLAAGMMVKTVTDRIMDSDLGSNFKYCSNTNKIFSC